MRTHHQRACATRIAARKRLSGNKQQLRAALLQTSTYSRATRASLSTRASTRRICARKISGAARAYNTLLALLSNIILFARNAQREARARHLCERLALAHIILTRILITTTRAS